jgi:DNA gyrase/topoisomerase IV subunit A
LKHKSYPLNISRQIDTNFRNYALYVLENRGIPSFYDGLTNVQRFIMINAPTNYNKTISLVGSCISDGYHHGDKSLTGAINKLARPFGNSDQLLLGDGFFGTPINHEASAARYTSIKINPKIAEIIRKNNFLNEKNEEGSWNPLWVDLPIGLTNTIVGIAVGYKTTVLPRSLDDIQKFLNGKIKEVHPKFRGFTGKITRYKGMDKTWLIEGVVKVNDSERTIHITEIPPLMKYGSFLRKLDSVMSNYANVSLTNNSSTNIDLLLRFRGSLEEWQSFVMQVDRSNKILVTETPVFIKDGLVIEYDRIEDYVNDYRYRLADLQVRKLDYFKRVNDEELLFQMFKEKYLLFMLETKGKRMRTDEEISAFLKDLTKGYEQVQRRLDAILLRSLSEEELDRTRKKIAELKVEVARQEIELTEARRVFESMEDTALKRATQNRSNSITDLFSDEEEIDGIEVFTNSTNNNKHEEEHETENDN